MVRNSVTLLKLDALSIRKPSDFTYTVTSKERNLTNFLNLIGLPWLVAQLIGVSSHAPEGCRFNSWSVSIQKATGLCCSHTLVFLSLSLSLPAPQSIKDISTSEDFFKNLIGSL